MAISKEEFLDAVGAMSVMELNDLVKAFEEKFGVSAAAMAAPAAGGAASCRCCHCSCRHAELLFESLDQVVQFHDRHCANCVQELFFANCHLKLQILCVCSTGLVLLEQKVAKRLRFGGFRCRSSGAFAFLCCDCSQNSCKARHRCLHNAQQLGDEDF